ncbi:MAG: aminoacyl-tRNA hydrolase [Minisyncoccota bacterium]
MKVIIGLGNPGTQYALTRHNVGFLCVDFLRDTLQAPHFVTDQKISAQTSSVIFEGQKILLLKPETFMNRSGESVQKVMQFYKVPLSNILIIHDDIDRMLGTYKISSSSRSAGHNGVQHIIDSVGTQEFMRIRVGIGHPVKTPDQCISLHQFVLQSFTETELPLLIGTFPSISNEVIHWIQSTT